jgi:AraC family transcriptional regulator
MRIDVVERPAVRVACMHYTGPPGEPLGRFWRGTVAPWLAEHGLVDCPRYGISLDDPVTTPPEQCRYDACVELPPGLSLPGVDEATIRGGRYAITHFKGPGAHLGAAWSTFRRECQAVHRLDPSRPAFERHPRGAQHDARTGIFACELCLPVSA